jgi:hypothetical protein
VKGQAFLSGLQVLGHYIEGMKRESEVALGRW